MNTAMKTTEPTWKLVAGISVFITLNVIVWALTRGGAHTDPKLYPFIDPSRGYIAQEHFIVNIQPLRDHLRELVQHQTEMKVSLYLEFLNTGANISINPDLRIWPASTVKLPLALAVMKKIELGTWTLDTQLELLEKHKDDGYGSLYTKESGTLFTVRELLYEMLANSDNTAYWVLINDMTPDELSSVIEETGLNELFDTEGNISAKEYSRLFRSLYNASFISREDSSYILSLLMQTPRVHVGETIPNNVPFAHKWGGDDTRNVFLDSGIVYLSNRPYVITVVAQGDPDKVQNFMREVGTLAYTYFEQYTK